MATGEDQAQAVVLDTVARAIPICSVFARRIGPVVQILDEVEARAPAQRIDRLEAPGRYQPGTGVGRQPLLGPLLERGAKGIVQALLGQVEVAEQADQRGKAAARLGAVDLLHLPAHCRRRGLLPCVRCGITFDHRGHLRSSKDMP